VERLRRRVRVRGTVQGVGFRPFVYRRAVALGLAGWVANDAGGVVLEVEGGAAAVQALLRALQDEAPPLAVVEGIEAGEVAPTGQVGFGIRASEPSGGVDVPVGVDVAPCVRCLAEMADPHDRRSDYPFVNCTDCGPRYTIVQRVPYDRPATTMAGFVMCARCQAEYDDPADRRFHAQPNACPACGPRLAWEASDVAVVGPPALHQAARCLRDGGIVAVKGIGGYHLACGATDAEAVAVLRKRKARNDKPFAVMVADLDAAGALCHLAEPARCALVSARRPIVLARRRTGSGVADVVAPGLDELGIMLPSSPLHVLLLAAVGRPLVMTSGNVSDEPVIHRDDVARDRLLPVADGLLTHDREIHVRADDSVLRTHLDGTARMVRRARGWVPQPLRLPVPATSPVLAVGAQLKSTVALARAGSVVVSQHLGDLEHWAAYRGFVETIDHLTGLGDVRPTLVAHDLHPDYRSTAWARDQELPLLPVQHHHAHVAACLAEHGMTGPVLGLAFDGVGLGTDGTLWGGEFLLVDLTSSARVAHLSTVCLPGGDAAVREPWRIALAWLHRSVGASAAAEHGPAWDPRWRSVLSLIESGTQPQTSSMGRLFDAVAVLLGLRTSVSYEGQAAVELEALALRADPHRAPRYPLPSADGLLDAGPLVAAVLADVRRGTPPEQVAAGFHLGLAAGAAELAVTLAADHGLDTVALSGGVFQNAVLTHLLATRLRRAGLRVLLHEHVPPNDGSISLGQAAIAAAVQNTGTGQSG
jgi:hydrogenase maturation protein HypF